MPPVRQDQPEPTDRPDLPDLPELPESAPDAADAGEHLRLDDKAAVARWAKRLGTTDEALVKAVQRVGTRIDHIKDYLGQGGMAADQSVG